MSLRLRLTLLYTSLLGGTMLLVSALVYGLVNVILLWACASASSAEY